MGILLKMENSNLLLLEKKSKLREYACEFLRKDIELLHFTGLTGRQQRLIECGCVI